MSKALNIIVGISILWVLLHAVWNIGNFEGFSGDLLGAQRFEGFLAKKYRYYNGIDRIDPM